MVDPAALRLRHAREHVGVPVRPGADQAVVHAIERRKPDRIPPHLDPEGSVPPPGAPGMAPPTAVAAVPGQQRVIRSLFPRHRTASVTAVVLAAVLLVAAVAEAAARTLPHSRLTAAAGRVLGEDGDVDIDGGPALLALFDRHLDAVTISGDHATLGRIPDVSVHARLNDIRLTGSRSGTVAHTHAEVQIPAESLQSMADAHGNRLPITAVHLDAAADAITLDLRDGLGRATLRPGTEDGRLALRLEDADILGSPAPARLVDRIKINLADRADTDYPLRLKATALDVTPTGP
ncbi:LmeA family phospholipid-binding protein [Streptomyces flaveolus]|uniref:LmeA family phospholipid-binding protein n=1 Tax=Streptomyces flaveolus TaxID=67297 RepID=UPI00342737A9